MASHIITFIISFVSFRSCETMHINSQMRSFGSGDDSMANAFYYVEAFHLIAKTVSNCIPSIWRMNHHIPISILLEITFFLWFCIFHQLLTLSGVSSSNKSFFHDFNAAFFLIAFAPHRFAVHFAEEVDLNFCLLLVTNHFHFKFN